MTVIAVTLCQNHQNVWMTKVYMTSSKQKQIFLIHSGNNNLQKNEVYAWWNDTWRNVSKLAIILENENSFYSFFFTLVYTKMKNDKNTVANLEVFLLGNVINYKPLISQEWQKVGVRNKQGRDFLSS